MRGGVLLRRVQRLSFDEANKVGDITWGRGEFGGLDGLGFHKELNVAKDEGGGDCVCSSRTVFTGLEEEE